MSQTLTATAPSTSKQIGQLVKKMRRTRSRIAYHEAKLDAIKEALQPLLEASGNWSDSEGYARLIGESSRISYDRESIDELIIRDPGFECLRAFRKVSTIRASVSVK